MKVFVIVPAAGLGTRMAPPKPAKSRKQSPSKQFKELDGVPILVHTLRKFAADPRGLRNHCRPSKMRFPAFGRKLKSSFPKSLKKRLQLVEGGEHRQDSVASALAHTAADADDLVLVHDAVRPLVARRLLRM